MRRFIQIRKLILPFVCHYHRMLTSSEVCLAIWTSSRVEAECNENSNYYSILCALRRCTARVFIHYIALSRCTTLVNVCLRRIRPATEMKTVILHKSLNILWWTYEWWGKCMAATNQNQQILFLFHLFNICVIKNPFLRSIWVFERVPISYFFRSFLRRQRNKCFLLYLLIKFAGNEYK